MKSEKSTRKQLARIMSSFWRLFSSIKLALVMILVMTCLSLIGTFFAPVEFFHTWWFLTPGMLLMLNILVCSINRWKNIRAILRGGEVRQPDSFYTGSDSNAEIVDIRLHSSDIIPVVETTLQKQGYRIRIESAPACIYLAADKNRYFKLGTYVSHFSLLLFVLAFIIGSSLGFRDNNFVVIEGETQEVRHNTGISISLVSFIDEYYADGTPKDYRSKVILYKNGQEVRQALIRVNHPLKYAGVRFYQSFFGPAIRIRLEQNGDTIYQGNVALMGVSSSQGFQRFVGYLKLPESGFTFRFLSSAINAPDPMIPAGQLALEIRRNGSQIGLDLLSKEIPLGIADIECIYQEDIQFSGFQVSRDPGNFLVWIASSLFVIGIILVLYFAYRQMWILIQPLSPEKSRIFIRLTSQPGSSNAAELKRIIRVIKKEGGEDQSTKSRGGSSG